MVLIILNLLHGIETLHTWIIRHDQYGDLLSIYNSNQQNVLIIYLNVLAKGMYSIDENYLSW